MKTIEDVKIHIPIEVRRLDALAHACKKAKSNDFKGLWFQKLIMVLVFHGQKNTQQLDPVE